MSRPGETINAAVLATTIRIDAAFEADVRTLVMGYDCFGVVAKILCRSSRLLFCAGIGIDNIDIGKIDMELFESVGRAPGSAAPVDWLTALWRLRDNWLEFLLVARVYDKMFA